MTDDEVVGMLAEVGYQCIEYSLRHLDPRSMSPAEMSRVVALTRAGGITVSEYVVQREFVHHDPAVRAAELGLTADCIRAAGDLGIPIVNCFTGPAPFLGIGSPTLHRDIDEGDAWGMVLEAFDRIVPVAEDCGVRIAVEAVYGMVCREYYTLAELLRRYDTDHLGVNYDPSHMVLHDNSVGWTIRQLADRILHCHVKDVAGVAGKVMGETFLFPHLGEGRVDWADFFAAMAAGGYRGCMSIEFEAFDYFETAMNRDLRRVAETCYRDYVSLVDRFA